MVDRAQHFGPVKNANDPENPRLVDTPAVAQAMIHAEHKAWVEKILEEDFLNKFPNPLINIEVDLMLSYQGEGELLAQVVRDFPDQSEDVDSIEISEKQAKILKWKTRKNPRPDN